jgi:hypothetical protein
VSPEPKTNGVSSHAFEAAIARCHHCGHSWYDVSDRSLPKDARQGLELHTEELHFQMHCLVDIIPVFRMMDKLGCTLHYKQDILIFVFAGWLENSLFQGQNNVLKLSQRLKQEAYIFRKSMCK